MASHGDFINLEWVQNGSLWENSFGYYPRASSDPEANITFYPNHTIELSFQDRGQNLMLGLSVLTQVIDSTKNLVYINCTYPLSGQYDHLPRVLFYCVIVFAVLFRHRMIIAEAALGVVMSYSATAYIHLFVLLGSYSFVNPETTTEFGDTDFFGIAPVVALSAIVLIPMLHWSRSFKVNQGRSILVLWTILIIVSFVTVCVYAVKWGSGNWWFYTFPSVAVCRRDFPDLPISNPDVWVAMTTLEDYIACDCVDYCGITSPKAPLRAKQGMAAFLSYRATGKFYYKNRNAEIYDEPLNVAINLEYSVAILWIFALVQVILAFLCVNSSSESVRNRVFKFTNATLRDTILTLFKGRRQDVILNKLGLQHPHSTETAYRRLRRLCAKIIAGSPVAERSDSIGSWAPWVAALFLLLSSVVTTLSKIAVALVCTAYAKVLRFIQYDPEERIPVEFDYKQHLEVIPDFQDLAAHVNTVMKYAWWYFTIRVTAFKIWWKDPEKYSAKEFSGSFKG
ncbi:hypothetical protein F4779DRAFT_636400 [Xylariaceae sp. FL0662B]|nr:hypothetical protein F4779DRAFT_636400 [Xylariaceae sp. FL0662B]